MHAHARRESTHAVTAAPRRVDLQLELTLLRALQLAPRVACSAVTPTLRRLVARSRIEEACALLGEPTTTAHTPLPAAAAAAGRARQRALLESTLLPLVSTSPATHPELHARLHLAIQLAQLDSGVRGAWRDLERLVVSTPVTLRTAWQAAVCDMIDIETAAWQELAEAQLPDQPIADLTGAQRLKLWQQAQAQHHPAAPRLWMWMTLLSTRAERQIRYRRDRAPILFS
ncbi:MAG: hypothetical protein ACI8S6_000079 [Myxococcota bacterium]|jgi:hypothetical protein